VVKKISYKWYKGGEKSHIAQHGIIKV